MNYTLVAIFTAAILGLGHVVYESNYYPSDMYVQPSHLPTVDRIIFNVPSTETEVCIACTEEELAEIEEINKNPPLCTDHSVDDATLMPEEDKFWREHNEKHNGLTKTGYF